MCVPESSGLVMMVVTKVVKDDSPEGPPTAAGTSISAFAHLLLKAPWHVYIYTAAHLIAMQVGCPHWTGADNRSPRMRLVEPPIPPMGRAGAIGGPARLQRRGATHKPSKFGLHRRAGMCTLVSVHWRRWGQPGPARVLAAECRPPYFETACAAVPTKVILGPAPHHCWARHGNTRCTATRCSRRGPNSGP